MNFMTVDVLAVVISILGVFVVSNVVTALSVYAHNFVVVPFDPAHLAYLELHHFFEVDVRIEHLIEPSLDTQNLLKLLQTSCIPSFDLIISQTDLLFFVWLGLFFKITTLFKILIFLITCPKKASYE